MNDRAIEVLAHAYARRSSVPSVPSQAHWKAAEDGVEALASAGLQITDLTPEDGKVLIEFLETADVPPESIVRESHAALEAEVEITAKLRRLSGASSPASVDPGGET